MVLQINTTKYSDNTVIETVFFLKRINVDPLFVKLYKQRSHNTSRLLQITWEQPVTTNPRFKYNSWDCLINAVFLVKL